MIVYVEHDPDPEAMGLAVAFARPALVGYTNGG